MFSYFIAYMWKLKNKRRKWTEIDSQTQKTNLWLPNGKRRKWIRSLGLTDQFYLGKKGKYILEAWGHAYPKDVKRERESAHGRERLPAPFGSSFYKFFPPLDLPYVTWASQECSLSYLRSSLQSSDLPLFYFHGLFPSLSFIHCHSGLLFPILTT